MPTLSAALCPGRRADPGPLAVIARLGAELLGHVALERPDGDGTIDLAAATGLFAGGGADPPAHRGEGIREPGRQVGLEIVPIGDGRHVGPGIGVHRAGRETGDVLVEEREAADHQIHRARWAHLRANKTCCEEHEPDAGADEVAQDGGCDWPRTDSLRTKEGSQTVAMRK